MKKWKEQIKYSKNVFFQIFIDKIWGNYLIKDSK